MVRRLVSGRRHLLYAKPPKPPAMPCRWFLFCPVSRPCFDGSRCRVRLDGGQARGTSPVNTSHRRQGVDDLALQDAFQAVFPSISRGVWRHFRVVTGLFIYLSGIKALLLRRNCGRLLRRSPLAAELLSSCSKLLERRAVFAYPVCAFRFGRDRGGQFCMSDVWAL